MTESECSLKHCQRGNEGSLRVLLSLTRHGYLSGLTLRAQWGRGSPCPGKHHRLPLGPHWRCSESRSQHWRRYTYCCGAALPKRAYCRLSHGALPRTVPFCRRHARPAARPRHGYFLRTGTRSCDYRHGLQRAPRPAPARLRLPRQWRFRSGSHRTHAVLPQRATAHARAWLPATGPRATASGSH